MGLLDGNKADAGSVKVTTDDDKKSKKLEALKRFKERRAQKVKEDWARSLKLRDELTKAGVFEKLSADVRAFVVEQCKDPAERRAASGGSNGLPSLVYTLFGTAPKVGDKVTLSEAFNKTAKGKATIEILIRRWAKSSGVIVEVIPNAKVMMTEYVIKTLPAVVA